MSLLKKENPVGQTGLFMTELMFSKRKTTAIYLYIYVVVIDIIFFVALASSSDFLPSGLREREREICSGLVLFVVLGATSSIL